MSIELEMYDVPTYRMMVKYESKISPLSNLFISSLERIKLASFLI